MGMTARVVPFFLTCGLIWQSPGQAVSPVLPKPKVPDRVIYEAFFVRVKTLDRLAGQMDGKNPQAAASARSQIQTQGRLTDKEMAILRTAAVDCMAQLAAVDAVARPLVRAHRTPPPATINQLKNLQSKRDQTIANHIETLRRSLGAGRFEKLDAFIRQTSSVKPVPNSGRVIR